MLHLAIDQWPPLVYYQKNRNDPSKKLEVIWVYLYVEPTEETNMWLHIL